MVSTFHEFFPRVICVELLLRQALQVVGRFLFNSLTFHPMLHDIPDAVTAVNPSLQGYRGRPAHIPSPPARGSMADSGTRNASIHLRGGGIHTIGSARGQ